MTHCNADTLKHYTLTGCRDPVATIFMKLIVGISPIIRPYCHFISFNYYVKYHVIGQITESIRDVFLQVSQVCRQVNQNADSRRQELKKVIIYLADSGYWQMETKNKLTDLQHKEQTN